MESNAAFERRHYSWRTGWNDHAVCSGGGGPVRKKRTSDIGAMTDGMADVNASALEARMFDDRWPEAHGTHPLQETRMGSHRSGSGRLGLEFFRGQIVRHEGFGLRNIESRFGIIRSTLKSRSAFCKPTDGWRCRTPAHWSSRVARI